MKYGDLKDDAKELFTKLNIEKTDENSEILAKFVIEKGKEFAKIVKELIDDEF